MQVGAFRQRQQAEVKAKLLRSKGFDCRIEVPQSSEALYLLKVGQFKSRAEAVAVQLRLKKNGIRFIYQDQLNILSAGLQPSSDCSAETSKGFHFCHAIAIAGADRDS